MELNNLSETLNYSEITKSLNITYSSQLQINDKDFENCENFKGIFLLLSDSLEKLYLESIQNTNMKFNSVNIEMLFGELKKIWGNLDIGERKEIKMIYKNNYSLMGGFIFELELSFKYKLYTTLFNKMKNKKIINIKKYNNVAVFGIGTIGSLLISYFNKNGYKIDCIVDNYIKDDFYLNIPVKSLLDCDFSNIDCLIVTPIYDFEEISEHIKKVSKVRVLSALDLFAN